MEIENSSLSKPNILQTIRSREMRTDVERGSISKRYYTQGSYSGSDSMLIVSR